MYAEALALGIMGGFVILILMLTLLSLLPAMFYLLTLRKALQRCHPSHRTLQPGHVWLMLIPCFNLFWHFYLVLNVSDSLDREFSQRGLPAEPLPGKSMGLAMCILHMCGIIPYLGMLTLPAGLVCWIVYWNRIADCSSRLAGDHPASMEGMIAAG